ncbi:cryptochrome/photolyase family protein [Malaciobacter mytili]|uniref:Cryptochrome/photolyase family protein n=1 Tax=Malaciobacter mytili LMG 24559 TaxID=1032238 RepID=A0AAX2AF82_9BACT|nr:cryptochrome/photolyase family protein [Malaciobacter mytili]AXH14930.1 deoxyribodipyrimidine photolyase-related protein [Malaciobacter mytili LMG 24559]RXI43701.1 cryptochrome/photolyase family protein [Malaciobacter mytili]RXK14856.1 cryptochrome/photolyase family protein [Malaciobacter mytili LMG 24559]
MEIFILYPNQLFQNISKLKDKTVLLIEEPLFFTQYTFHIQKLVLHRASMKFYEDYLQKNSIKVLYFEDETYLNKYKNEKIFIYELFDNYLEKKIYKNFKNITILKNPNFINAQDKSKLLHNFYINRRKELNIFIKEGKPLYGKYSFDSENRKKLPKNIFIPATLSYENRFINEAKQYCKKFNSQGKIETFNYPVTFQEASLQLEYFIKDKFHNFGNYQDAITKNTNLIYLFHSNLSSSLNIGLLNLNDVIRKVIEASAPYNAKEGFIRQLIGWREFMLRVYEDEGIKLRNSNFFNFKNSMPKAILQANSGITILDDIIKKVNNTAYAHHIERLMVLGNIFVLLEINPNEVYKYFMQNFIDAYDWVMVGNVYAMSGYCDGGSITTKPYICSSNYLLKMSDYKKDNWCEILDALYWRFLAKYQHLFINNPRMKMQLAILNKMPKEKLEKHINIANTYIKNLYCNL